MSSARLLQVMVVSALVTLQTTAGAQTPADLGYRLDVDGPITLAGSIGWFAAISQRESIGPAACQWCATNSFDLGVRRALLWRDPLAAEHLVDIVGFAVGPAATLGADLVAAQHDGAWQQSLVDALLVTEAATVASDVNLAVRFAVARQRPWAWAAAPSAGRSRDSNMSFYSGHATMMFAVATAAGTVAEMRGYRWAPLVWLVGMPLALATSYLRIASDDHWTTDVLVGMAAGGAMGFAIPFFAHHRVRIVPAGGTLSVVGSF